MGLRKYKRQVARTRMQAAGVGNVGKKMRIGGLMQTHGAMKRLMRTAHGRRWLAVRRAESVANWRRALQTQKNERRRIRRVAAHG